MPIDQAFFFAGWDEVFWLLSIISLLLSIILFGLPYMSSRTLSKITRGRVDQVRLRRFFGSLVFPCFAVLVVIIGLFLTKTVYEFVAYFQVQLSPTHKLEDINGISTLIITTIVLAIVIGGIIYWVKRLWNASTSSKEKIEKTDDEQLRDSIKTLTQKLNKLDKLGKLDKIDKLDRLLNYLESKPDCSQSHRRPN